MSPWPTHEATGSQDLSVVREIVRVQSPQTGLPVNLVIFEYTPMGRAFMVKGPPRKTKANTGSTVGCDCGFDLTHRLHPIEGVGYPVKRVCASDQVLEGELAILQELKRLVKMPASS